MADDVNLKTVAKKTENYSGSDLRNVCVASSLARIKENILMESAPPNEKADPVQIRSTLDKIDDWSTFLAIQDESEESRRPNRMMAINGAHIDIGLGECPPSLSEEMQTLVELRKWDSMYGDGAAQRKKKSSSIGFELSNKI